MLGVLDPGCCAPRCAALFPRQIHLCRLIQCKLYFHSQPIQHRPPYLRRGLVSFKRDAGLLSVDKRLTRKQKKGGLCSAAYSGAGYGPDSEEVNLAVSEAARKALNRASDACRQVGWIGFWIQLSLSIVSAGILLFSIAFTAQNGPASTLWLTIFGIVCAVISTFWSFGYTRLARKLRGYSQTGKREALQRVRKKDVLLTLERGCWLNLIGMAATMLGLQATVGLLVAKTLTNATANPFLSGGAGSYNPVLALDVFLVQASTNTLLSHLASLLCTLYLIRVVSANAPVPQIGGRPVPS
eukprot:jgi/Botrbrau1/1429/Bobra.0063s0121.1